MKNYNFIFKFINKQIVKQYIPLYHTPFISSTMSKLSITSFFHPLDSKGIQTNTKKRKQEDEEKKQNNNAPSSSATTAAAASSSSSSSSSSPPSSSSSSSFSKDSDLKRQKIDSLSPLIPPSWSSSLSSEFTKPYWSSLEKFLLSQSNANVTVFPPRNQIFRALDLVPLEEVKVVIIGQDPYHSVSQAEGLCFSVPHGIAIPSSLRNMYKELHDDLGAKEFKKPSHGNLVEWAKQGILLLNTGLTVKANEPNSHKDAGWSHFTDSIIKLVNQKCKGVVFLLWGAHAQKKEVLIDQSKHHVLKAAHPSGLSASRGFYGCKFGSKTNQLLTKEGKTPIKWQV
jgi:uracil-DNA glycosylase